MSDKPFLLCRGRTSWRAQELAHISNTAAIIMARMCMRIEEGCQLPTQVELARGNLFGQGATATAQTLGFRLLTVASHVYRNWAVLRLESLEQWLGDWVGKDMHGGQKGARLRVPALPCH